MSTYFRESKSLMKQRKKTNREASVGVECACPTCSTKFIKESYQQVFCKSKGGTVCKDGYWNFVDESKRNNTTRISPANQRNQDNWNTRRESDIDDGMDFLLDCGSWD